jgi:tetratricopeptide (TPR) repeat protein
MVAQRADFPETEKRSLMEARHGLLPGATMGRTVPRRYGWIALAALGAASWTATAAATTIDEDRAEARRLFDASNCEGALPLLERVATARPEDAPTAELLAFCLMSRVMLMPLGPERDQTLARERDAAERAKALGDDSNLLHVVQEHLAAPPPTVGASGLDAAMLDAEKAFTQGNLDEALRRYVEIAASNPRSYEARLYAGDVYFRKKDIAGASEWFRKAIAVDPDRETAYRYFGDALDGAGQTGEALEQFIDAVVAQPFERRAWAGLSQWAARHDRQLVKPAVPTLSAPKTGATKDGKPNIEITFNPSQPQAMAAAALAYSMMRAMWMGEKFAKEFPDEKTYRHSLREELEALSVTLEVAKSDAAVRAALGDLPKLADDDMLSAYVLLCTPDEGLSRDYAGYRNAHRAQLHEFLRRYVVVPAKH